MTAMRNSKPEFRIESITEVKPELSDDMPCVLDEVPIPAKYNDRAIGGNLWGLRGIRPEGRANDRITAYEISRIT